MPCPRSDCIECNVQEILKIRFAHLSAPCGCTTMEEAEAHIARKAEYDRNCAAKQRKRRIREAMEEMKREDRMSQKFAENRFFLHTGYSSEELREAMDMYSPHQKDDEMNKTLVRLSKTTYLRNIIEGLLGSSFFGPVDN